MNEKHALNLENLVAQRNAELAGAREETERLLHEMLPPSIAKQLKVRVVGGGTEGTKAPPNGICEGATIGGAALVRLGHGAVLSVGEADQHKAHKSVPSDQVDFSTVLSKFPPTQVVDFLNQVFSTFDNIIRNHDAYKVETTGEVSDDPRMD